MASLSESASLVKVSGWSRMDFLRQHYWHLWNVMPRLSTVALIESIYGNEAIIWQSGYPNEYKRKNAL